jgi:ubiquinone/menaquinone biosynthesis C-methylase UbiE
MNLQVLSTQEFYTQVTDYMHHVDPTWDEERWQVQLITERAALAKVLGQTNGGSVLDCSCGSGGQAIPLAKLGWQVTATDVTEASLHLGTQRARQVGVNIDFHVGDMRQLSQTFSPSFDWVISCMALDNLTIDQDIQQALDEMFAVLKPEGKCYIRLRDFDNIMADKPHYDFKEERLVPDGRIIRLEDWRYESETHVICMHVFLWEDHRKQGYRWKTDVFSFRRRAIRKAELQQFLVTAGFSEITFLPRSNPWQPYEVVASS